MPVSHSVVDNYSGKCVPAAFLWLSCVLAYVYIWLKCRRVIRSVWHLSYYSLKFV
jgi:hypothetical protein